MRKHVVFVHGYLENSDMWNSVLGRISKSHLELHFPEIPGHGKRLSLPASITMDAYADDIMKQLNISEDEKFIFVGHSMGGYIGANIGRRYGHRLEALCLFQSKTGADDEEKKNARDRAMEAAAENKPLYIRSMITGLFDAALREKLDDKIEAQIAYARQLETKALVASLTVMKNREDETSRLKDRNFSLFYFLGENDPSISVTTALKEIEQLPGAAYHIEPGIGHMAHFEAPVSAGDFIQRMIRAVAP